MNKWKILPFIAAAELAIIAIMAGFDSVTWKYYIIVSVFILFCLYYFAIKNKFGKIVLYIATFVALPICILFMVLLYLIGDAYGTGL